MTQRLKLISKPRSNMIMLVAHCNAGRNLVGTGTYGVSQSPLHFNVSLLLLCVASLL